MNVQNLAGQTLGKYTLRKLLGEGGMGAVYLAFQNDLEREVALKVLPALLAEQEEYVARFTREAKTAASLEHAHIVPVYDYGTEGGISYVVMRLLNGGSLADRLAHGAQAGRALPSLGEVADITRQLASALDYAHARGVVHRDIKPNNIMFDNQGTAFVVDFGIAKLTGVASGLTGTGVAMGTPSYMAPEQWSGRGITAAVDQYALAVLVYSMLTGKLPFEAETPYQLMHKHMYEPPTPLNEFRPELPDTLMTVLVRALAKEPDARYPSVTAFSQALGEAIQGITGAQQRTGFFTTPLPPRPTPAPVRAPLTPRGDMPDEPTITPSRVDVQGMTPAVQGMKSPVPGSATTTPSAPPTVAAGARAGGGFPGAMILVGLLIVFLVMGVAVLVFSMLAGGGGTPTLDPQQVAFQLMTETAVRRSATETIDAVFNAAATQTAAVQTPTGATAAGDVPTSGTVFNALATQTAAVSPQPPASGAAFTLGGVIDAGQPNWRLDTNGLTMCLDFTARAPLAVDYSLYAALLDDQFNVLAELTLDSDPRSTQWTPGDPQEFCFNFDFDAQDTLPAAARIGLLTPERVPLDVVNTQTGVPVGLGIQFPLENVGGTAVALGLAPTPALPATDTAQAAALLTAQAQTATAQAAPTLSPLQQLGTRRADTATAQAAALLTAQAQTATAQAAPTLSPLQQLGTRRADTATAQAALDTSGAMVVTVSADGGVTLTMPVGETRTFAFAGTAGGWLMIDALGSGFPAGTPYESQPKLSVFAPDGALLYDDVRGYVDETGAWYAGITTMPLAQDGTYQIVVENFLDRPFEMTLRVLPLVTLTQDPLLLNASVNVSGAPLRVELLPFDADSTQVYGVTVTLPRADYGSTLSDVYVMDENGYTFSIERYQDYAIQTDTYIFKLPESGRYTLVMFLTALYPAGEPYSVILNTPDVPQIAVNDVVPLPADSAMHYFRVTLDAGVRYVAVCTDGTELWAAGMMLFADGVLYTEVYVTGNFYFYEGVTPGISADYLMVFPAYNYPRGAPYNCGVFTPETADRVTVSNPGRSVRLRADASGDADTLTTWDGAPAAVLGWRQNDSEGVVWYRLRLSDGTEGWVQYQDDFRYRIAPPGAAGAALPFGDSQWTLVPSVPLELTIDLKANMYLRVQVTSPTVHPNAPGDALPRLSVLLPDGSVLWDSYGGWYDTATNTFRLELVPLFVPADGTYRFVVTGGLLRPTDLNVRVDDLPVTDRGALQYGDNPGTAGQPGIELWTFEVTDARAPHVVQLNYPDGIASDNGLLSLRFRDAYFWDVVRFSAGSSERDWLLFVPPEPGSYQVVLYLTEGYGDGAYTLRLDAPPAPPIVPGFVTRFDGDNTLRLWSVVIDEGQSALPVCTDGFTVYRPFSGRIGRETLRDVVYGGSFFDLSSGYETVTGATYLFGFVTDDYGDTDYACAVLTPETADLFTVTQRGANRDVLRDPGAANAVGRWDGSAVTVLGWVTDDSGVWLNVRLSDGTEGWLLHDEAMRFTLGAR